MVSFCGIISELKEWSRLLEDSFPSIKREVIVCGYKGECKGKGCSKSLGRNLVPRPPWPALLEICKLRECGSVS
jgi:hypothetical protein